MGHICNKFLSHVVKPLLLCNILHNKYNPTYFLHFVLEGSVVYIVYHVVYIDDGASQEIMVFQNLIGKLIIDIPQYRFPIGFLFIIYLKYFPCNRISMDDPSLQVEGYYSISHIVEGCFHLTFFLMQAGYIFLKFLRKEIEHHCKLSYFII